MPRLPAKIACTAKSIPSKAQLHQKLKRSLTAARKEQGRSAVTAAGLRMPRAAASMCHTFNATVDFRASGGGKATRTRTEKGTRKHKAKSTQKLTREESRAAAQGAWRAWDALQGMGHSLERHCEELFTQGRVLGVMTCVSDARTKRLSIPYAAHVSESFG